jgi:hypothetical protein
MPTPVQIEQFERQLTQHGEESLARLLRSHEADRPPQSLWAVGELARQRLDQRLQALDPDLVPLCRFPEP